MFSTLTVTLTLSNWVSLEIFDMYIMMHFNGRAYLNYTERSPVVVIFFVDSVFLPTQTYRFRWFLKYNFLCVTVITKAHLPEDLRGLAQLTMTGTRKSSISQSWRIKLLDRWSEFCLLHDKTIVFDVVNCPRTSMAIFLRVRVQPLCGPKLPNRLPASSPSLSSFPSFLAV